MSSRPAPLTDGKEVLPTADGEPQVTRADVPSKNGERRRHTRIPLTISARLQASEDGRAASSEEISPKGLRILAHVALPPGAPMSLQFSFADICYLNVSGQVVYCLPIDGASPQQWQVGIKFAAIREWEQQILASSLQELAQNRSSQEKSFINIIASQDELAVEAADISGRTPFLSRVARYRWKQDLQAHNLYLWERPLQSGCGPRVFFKGREMIMLASTSYLGLTAHPKVKEAAKLAIEKYGVGAGGVRLLTGTFELHERLEAKLAQFKGGEAALVFNSGYSTNVGAISGLLGRTDSIVLDKKDHASIFDGAGFSKSRIKTFRHNDLEHLRQVLESLATTGRSLIVVDSVYSMDGDIADLRRIYDLAQQYRSMVMIDEAHATGVLGRTGKGGAEHFELEGKIDIVMGTLSKGLGAIGGFVVANKAVIEYLKRHARSFVFSEALPPAICAAALAAIEVIETEPQWHAQLWKNTEFMRAGLRRLGFDTGESCTPIIPVIIGDEIRTRQFARRLEELGIYACPVGVPAVDPKRSRIRVSIMATHTEQDLDEALQAFERAGRELSII